MVENKVQKQIVEEFMEKLGQAGIESVGAVEAKERMAQAASWRSAFETLALYGKRIGIEFKARNGEGAKRLAAVMSEYGFSAACARRVGDAAASLQM